MSDAQGVTLMSQAFTFLICENMGLVFERGQLE